MQWIFLYFHSKQRSKKTNLPQPPWNWKPKTTLLLYIVIHPFSVTPRDFYRVHFTWQLLCHTVILRPIATHTYRTKENNIKISILSNTNASPFSDPPLSPHRWEQTLLAANKKKKNMFPWKTLKPLSIHTHNPKVRNLLHLFILNVMIFGINLVLSIF